MTNEEFDKAITVRANAYAHSASDDVMEWIGLLVDPGHRNEIRKHVDVAIARAFVLGVAAGIEAERGPVARRPVRGHGRRR